MRGHIKKRKNSWAVVVYMGRDPETGKHKYDWQSVKGSKKQAEQVLHEKLNNKEKGIYIKPTKRTVADFLRQWLRDYVETNTAPRTAERYRDIINRHLIPSLGRFPLMQLKPEHIQSYYTEAMRNGRLDGKGGLSPRTMQQHHRVLSEALNHAVKWDIIPRNVAKAIDPPRAERNEVNIISGDEINRLLAEARRLDKASGVPYHMLFFTALHTGLRRGELLALRWSDLDLDLASISVTRSLQTLADGSIMIKEPKTARSRRTVAMTPTLASELREYRTNQEALRLLCGKPMAEMDLVFSYPDGKAIKPNTVSPAFAKVSRRAGLNIRLHDLRHTHASLMLKAGVHPKIVSERLGHATVAFTLDIYSHVVPGLQEAAAKTFDDSLKNAMPAVVENRG